MAIEHKYEYQVTPYDKLIFYIIEEEQDAYQNYTLVRYKLVLTAAQHGTISSSAYKTWMVEVDTHENNGQNLINITQYSSKTLFENTTKVYHNVDGTKTLTWRYAQAFNITFAGEQIGTVLRSGTTKLQTISRPSTLTAPTSINLGDTIKFSFTAKSNTFLHKLFYRFDGSNTILIDRTSARSFLWTAPNTLATQFGNNSSMPIQFVLETYTTDDTFIGSNTVNSTLYLSSTQAPTVIVAVEDVNEGTTILTGDVNTLIRGYSDAKIDITASGKEGATIASYEIRNGSNVVLGASSTVIHGVEDGTFTIKVTDSRGVSTVKEITKKVIEYIKPTANITDINADVYGNLTFRISGICYDGSFGEADNRLYLMYRYAVNADVTQIGWTMLEAPVTVENGAYYANVTLTGLNYQDSYRLQAQCMDYITSASSIIYHNKVTPVYDWGENDFSINVPTTIQGGNAYGAQVLFDGSSGSAIYVTDSKKYFSNYAYIEIIYTDNNGRGSGSTKIYDLGSGTKTIDLALIESSSATGTYIRRTSYYCNSNAIQPETTTAGYVWINGNTVQHITGTNYLRIIKIIGYK